MHTPANPTILLTNDDGIDAQGLPALAHAFSQRVVALWVVAPDDERSGSSHGMSLNRPIRVTQHGKQRYSTTGTVADGVYFALFRLMPAFPDIVISGINHGANLGSDVIYSGTVAGAREAALRGIHALSISLVAGDVYDTVAQSAVDIALALLARPAQPPWLLNLNYPAPTFSSMVVAPLGERHYPAQVEQRHAPMGNRPYYWLGGGPVVDARIPGSDGDMIAKGHATLTPLALDQTRRDLLGDPGLSSLLDKS